MGTSQINNMKERLYITFNNNKTEVPLSWGWKLPLVTSLIATGILFIIIELFLGMVERILFG